MFSAAWINLFSNDFWGFPTSVSLLSSWLRTWNTATFSLPYQPSKIKINGIIWLLLETDANPTSDTTYCIFLITYPLAPESSQCFLIANQTEYKIIVLSWKTLNNNTSPSSLIIFLHISYTPAKLNCHHSPNMSHTLVHPCLFLGCSLCPGRPFPPLRLQKPFTAPKAIPNLPLLWNLPPELAILPPFRGHLPWLRPSVTARTLSVSEQNDF